MVHMSAALSGAVKAEVPTATGIFGTPQMWPRSFIPRKAESPARASTGTAEVGNRRMIGNYELTVKHVAPDATVTIYPTSKVVLRDDGAEFPKRGDELVVTRLTDGAVYVMNSAGKTVQSYHFNGPRP
jgi:hypothetical protein